MRAIEIGGSSRIRAESGTAGSESARRNPVGDRYTAPPLSTWGPTGVSTRTIGGRAASPVGEIVASGAPDAIMARFHGSRFSVRGPGMV